MQLFRAANGALKTELKELIDGQMVPVQPPPLLIHILEAEGQVLFKLSQVSSGIMLAHRSCGRQEDQVHRPREEFFNREHIRSFETVHTVEHTG